MSKRLYFFLQRINSNIPITIASNVASMYGNDSRAEIRAMVAGKEGIESGV